MNCFLQKIARTEFLLATLAFVLSTLIASAQTTIPDDVEIYCPISSNFKDLISYRRTANPPDNLSFSGDNSCNFIERSTQMFLWLTSPIRAKHNQGSYVFNSPLFYNAWSAGAGPRSLVPITGAEKSHGELRLNVKNDIEPGQAGGDAPVLMTQDGRLVYYLVEVNDVYAYFLTAQKNHEISASHFPDEQSELNDIEKFASSHKKWFADARTLVVELKSAWIDAAGFSKTQLKQYITMEAKIQTYIQSDSGTLKPDPNGVKEKKLALIGMHVVFSAKGHPEMVWATFEHINNTRNTSYEYFPHNNSTWRAEPADFTGDWILSTNSEVGMFNDARMHFDEMTGHIVAYNGKAIGPSNILRESPWGSSRPDDPNRNTEIMSVGKQVRKLLDAEDVRKYYLLIGATWTANGQPPDRSNQQGAANLVNTTMETFYNRPGEPSGVSNCFNCHTGSNMLGEKERAGLSHIFGVLTPLVCPPGRPCSPPRLVGEKK